MAERLAWIGDRVAIDFELMSGDVHNPIFLHTSGGISVGLLAVNSKGVVYVTDSANNLIRAAIPPAPAK